MCIEMQNKETKPSFSDLSHSVAPPRVRRGRYRSNDGTGSARRARHSRMRRLPRRSTIYSTGIYGFSGDHRAPILSKSTHLETS
jgi:hypothetical protein